MKKLKICYFGAYDPDYARNRIFLDGLRANEVGIRECHVSHHTRLWKRNVSLLLKYVKIPKDFDVILVAATNQFVVPLAKILSIISGKPLIFDIFFSLYDSTVKDRKTVKESSLKAKLLYLIDKISLHLSTFVLADTKQHFQYYHRFFNVSQDKMAVVYIGYDDNVFSFPINVPQKEDSASFNVVFTGSFIPLHGIEYILKAAKRLERYENIRFEFVGKGQTYNEMVSVARALELPTCVFRGSVPSIEVPSVLASADICLGIFGHTDKAKRVIPNKVYESLAMRKPVITGDSQVIREVFTHEEHLLLCNLADERSLAEGILRLYHDRALRSKIAENGSRLVKERFTPKELGKQLKEIIMSVL